jgi:hypothetical protein
VGRHKSDPQGQGRYLTIGGGIFVLVLLLVVGGLALAGSL